MAKKNKHDASEAPTRNQEPQVQDNHTQANTAEAPKTGAIRPSSHLVCETPDLKGRVAYRFAKTAEMPKRAAQYDITIDGKPAKAAYTTSGGYSEVVGYNAYIQKPDKDDGSKGDIGWILFNDGVNPLDPEQFPNGLHFKTVDGPCEANPVRLPKNPEAEQKRRDASAAAAKARKEAADAARAEQAAKEAAEAGQPQ